MTESLVRNKIRLRRLRAENPGYSTAKNAEWQAANPEKRSAHKAVEYAVKIGRLTRLPCEICGTTKSVHAHHDDYEQKLAVNWLCPTHHRERHRMVSCPIITNEAV